jgi:tetratricopeptide (TPR) repeat protein
LFLAVADRCRERGVEETERLLGAHGKLLAAYQTALIDVPGYTALPNPARAEGQEARARVLAAATHTVLSFAEMRPVLLVIDDLQWSDELSISLVQRLTEHGIDNSALLVIGTYRIDEVGGALKELVHSAGSHRLELERLSSFDVRAMVQGMLALREAEPPLVDYLQAQSNGNPFFIVEYLRAVIADGILTRDNHGRWLLASREPRFDPSPALPRSLTDLIERRLRQLGTAGRKMVDAASVLGREFDGDLLIACAGVDPRVAADALEGLREKQILEESQHGRLRFVHDGLRELAYAHIDPSTLGRLHGQAASAIEATYRESDLEPYYGDLGHHCDKSGARQRAAHYFELAGDDARRRFATGSAVRFFRRALAQTTDPDESDGRAARLKESLGELLLLHGDAVEARTNLEASIEGTDRSQRVVRARRLRKLARVMAQQHLHADALAAYVLAERALEEPSADDATTYWHEFVQIQVDAAWDLYFTAKVDELDALVERVRPTVERYGQPAQRSRFFIAIAQSLVRRARYRVSDSALTFTQLALEIGENASDPHERAAARFAHAFPLLLRGNYRAAEPLFVGAIEGAERVGDAALLTRSLAYFGVLLRQTRRLADARQVSERALNLAEKTRMNDYLGVASANLAWATLCEGDEAHIEPHVTRALDAWAALPVSYVYPLQWLARLPYAAYLDGVGQFGAAVAQLTFLVNEHQYLLADDVRAEIQRLGFEHARNGSLSFGEVLARSRTENYL